MAKPKCMRCGKRPATINNICLTCDTRWDVKKAKIREKKGRLWTWDDFYKWVMKKRDKK